MNYDIRFIMRMGFIVCILSYMSIPLASQDIRNQAKNVVTGQVIGDAGDWIYRQDSKTMEWIKLIPGCCAQWYPDGKRFVYFLDVGYEGSRSELWSADSTGEARIRLTWSDYYVFKSPIISPNGRKLAYHYSTSTAAGWFDDIVVIEVKGFDEKADAKVVLRKKAPAKPVLLKWLDDVMLQVKYGQEVYMVDTTKNGLPHVG